MGLRSVGRGKLRTLVVKDPSEISGFDTSYPKSHSTSLNISFLIFKIEMKAIVTESLYSRIEDQMR